MFGNFEFLIIFIPIIIIAAVIYGIIAWRRRESEPEIDPGIGTIRRIYFYVVSFASLMMAVNGVVLLVRFVLEGVFGAAEIASSSTPLAIGASLTIVGLPLWLFHWQVSILHSRRGEPFHIVHTTPK